MKTKINWSNPSEVRQYNNQWRKEHSSSWNAWRRNYRRTVQQNWGYGANGKLGGWAGTKAEIYALSQLDKYGFESASHLSGIFPFFPFDLRAIRKVDGRLCLIQVTMRTHADEIKRHRVLAELLNADYYVLFVSSALNRTILKHPLKEYCELLLKEVQPQSKFS